MGILPGATSAYPRASTDPKRYEYDHYFVKKQALKLIGRTVRVYGPDAQLLLYVEKKAFKLKEDVRVYADETKTTELLSIKARKVMDFSATYDVVESATGQGLGSLQRKGLKSMLRDEWHILDTSGAQIGRFFEDNAMLALVRRFIELGSLVPQSYDVELRGQKVADFKQRFNPFLYHLDLDFRADSGRQLDRRLGLAAGLMLALIEGRQG